MPSQIKDKIQKDQNDALKSGDQLKRLTLSMLVNAIKNKELAKRSLLSKTVQDISRLEFEKELSDSEILEVIASEIKKRKESIEQFNAGGREELAQKEKSEMDILLGYLPEQLGEEDIRLEVSKVISEIGAQSQKDMGKVISSVTAKLKGQADRGIISRIAKELLS